MNKCEFIGRETRYIFLYNDIRYYTKDGFDFYRCTTCSKVYNEDILTVLRNSFDFYV